MCFTSAYASMSPVCMHPCQLHSIVLQSKNWRIQSEEASRPLSYTNPTPNIPLFAPGSFWSLWGGPRALLRLYPIGLVDQEMRLSFRPEVFRLRTTILVPKTEPEAGFPSAWTFTQRPDCKSESKQPTSSGPGSKEKKSQWEVRTHCTQASEPPRIEG